MDAGTETLECVLCALKHIGKAEVLYLEAKNGYPHAFVLVLANLSLAEDHVAVKYPAQAAAIRTHRKALEDDPLYPVPWEDLATSTSLLEGYDLSSIFPRGDA